MRFGRNQEAFWGDYFNGVKSDNPWSVHLPAGQVAEKQRPLTIFGFEIPFGQRKADLDRPFMARFGDIVRIEARSLRHVRVTLESGTVFDLNRNAASDFDDGVRVWDDRGGVVDLAPWAGGIPPPSPVRITAIEFLPTPRLSAVPARLHGTVHTRGVTTREGRRLTGRLVYDLDESETTETLDAPLHGVDYTIPFGLIASITQTTVTLHDGEALRLDRAGDLGERNGGLLIFIDGSPRPEYVPWADVERIDLDRPPARS